MKPGKPLARTPMKPRTTPMPRGKGFAAAGREIPAAFAARKTRPRRETGFPERVRVAIWTRAGNGDPGSASCECCDRWLGSRRDGRGEIQHRSARGMGGCRDVVVNGTAGGVLLCRPCHSIAEARDEQMRHDGFWLEHGNGPEFDPRFASILLHSRAGPGVQLWLGTEGEYLFTAPEGLAA